MTKTKPWLPLGRPYGRGYQAPSTAQFITEKAHLHFGQGDQTYLSKNEEEIPEYMDLLVTLKPIPHTKTPFLQLKNDPFPLYQGELAPHAYQGIQLLFTQKGRIKGQFVSLEDKDIRFAPPDDDIPFSEHPSSLLHTFYYDTIDYDVFLDPEGNNPLLALGGPFSEGQALEDYTQSFIQFYEENNRLKYQITSLKKWWEMGLFPPLKDPKSPYRIPNNRVTSPYKSLLDSLRQGEATFVIPLGIDETGKEDFAVYHSIDAHRHGMGQAMITFNRYL